MVSSFSTTDFAITTGSRGCDKLIKHEAILVESARDIAEHLSTAIQGQLTLLAPDMESPKMGSTLNEEGELIQEGLLQYVGFEPLSLDEIQIASGLPADEISMQLMELEINGQICQQAGLYQRIK